MKTAAQEALNIHCGGCVFFSPNPYGAHSRGQCRRNAPMIDRDDDGRPRAIWPMVSPESFCGEHSSLEEALAA